MRSVEFLQLFSRIIAVCEKYRESLPTLLPLITRLKDAYRLLEEANTKVMASTYTLLLKELDEKRDQAYLSFRCYIEACAFSLDETKSKAARQIEFQIREVGWSLQSMSYLQQTVNLNNLIDILGKDRKMVQAMANIDAGPWFEPLKSVQTEFKNTEAQRNQEESIRSVATAKEAIPQIKDAFTKLTQMMEIMADIEQNERYKQLAGEINPIISDVMKKVRARQTRTENATDEILSKN